MTLVIARRGANRFPYGRSMSELEADLAGRAVKARRLLPHERWLADRIVRRQERAGSSPDALAGVAVGASLGNGQASIVTTSIFAAVGLGTIGFGTVRQVQAGRARKAYLRAQKS